MADQKLNLNINLGEIQYLGDNSWHDWHDELEFMTQKFWSRKVTEFLRQCYVVLFDSI